MTKILIADDDKLVTQLVEKLLSFEGYEVVAVNDSSKALEIAISVKPDLFILDLMMPQPDGFKLARMIRQDLNFSTTPILIITALDDDDSRAVAFGAGANDYLTKPFHPDELDERIENLLHGKELGIYD